MPSFLMFLVALAILGVIYEMAPRVGSLLIILIVLAALITGEGRKFT